MFHHMRRNRQELSVEASEAVLLRGSAGVLALTGDKAFPYAVPLSYVYDGEHIYFHSATEGHKIDAIQRNPNASSPSSTRTRSFPRSTQLHIAASSSSAASASSTTRWKSVLPSASSP